MDVVGEELGRLTIAARYCGPPGTGNGGYTCGAVASYVAADAVRVTLHSPPPIDSELVVRSAEEGATLWHNDVLIAEAQPATFDLERIEPPTWEQACEAAKGFPGHERHAFPTCFVCGPEREAGDGLRIFPGPAAGRDMVAAPWKPDASLESAGGFCDERLVWAALDCPGYFATGCSEMAVLGRMSACIHRLARVEQEHVLVAWPIGREGRELQAATALYQGSDALAWSEQVWILPE